MPAPAHISCVDKVLGEVYAQHVREGSGQRKAGAPYCAANVQRQGLPPLPCRQPTQHGGRCRSLGGAAPDTQAVSW